MAVETSVALGARPRSYGSVPAPDPKLELPEDLAGLVLLATAAVAFLAAGEFFPFLAPWSGAVYSTLFLIGGVVMARAPASPNLLLTCFSRVAPAYYLGLLLTFLRFPMHPTRALQRLLISSLFLQAWVPSSTDLNPPAWCIGPALLCVAVSPTAKALISPLRSSTKTLLLPTVLGFVIWAAWADLEASPSPGRALVYFTLNYIPFRAYLPVFVLGVVIGLHERRLHISLFWTRTITTCLVALLTVVVALTSPPRSLPESAVALLCLPLVLPLVFVSSLTTVTLTSNLLAVQQFLFPLAVPVLLLHAPLKALLMPSISQGSPLCSLFPSKPAGWIPLSWCELPVPPTMLASTLAAGVATVLVVSFRFVVDQAACLVIRARFLELADHAGRTRIESLSRGYSSRSLGTFYAIAVAFFFGFFQISAGGLYSLFRRPLFLFSSVPEKLSTLAILPLTLCLSSLAVNVLGHMRFAESILRTQSSSAQAQDASLSEKPTFPHKVYFRIVTRGVNKHLVRNTAESAHNALRRAHFVLPVDQTVIEVVTDFALDLPATCNFGITEIVVPKRFSCVSGAKFKARALQYAINVSKACDNDWIIHLDEESRFDVGTVQAIVSHLETSWATSKDNPIIGQGPIIYAKPGDTDERREVNWLTTLGDSFRVADDFGKFRIQYHYGEPWLGMHGSFVVCPSWIEKEIGFDHGMAGSITEDAYFAIVASTRGVKFTWIDAFMYEQSPFTVLDVVKQRSRWLGGLILVCGASELPIRKRIVLCAATLSWICLPLNWLTIITLTFCDSSMLSTSIFVMLTTVSWTMVTWCYLLGFTKTFRMEDGAARYLSLMYLQLLFQPIHGLIEAVSVVYTLVFFQSVSSSFHVVEKEASQIKETSPMRDAAV